MAGNREGDGVSDLRKALGLGADATAEEVGDSLTEAMNEAQYHEWLKSEIEGVWYRKVGMADIEVRAPYVIVNGSSVHTADLPIVRQVEGSEDYYEVTITFVTQNYYYDNVIQ